MKLRFCFPLLLAGSLAAQVTPPTYVPANTYSNAGTTGTTLHKLAKLSAANTVVRMGTTDTDGALGICTANCSTSGRSTIQWGGIVACAFDGATTLGHYVTISASTAGDCSDAGSTPPTAGQVVGVVLSTNGSGGNYNVNMQLRGPVPTALPPNGAAGGDLTGTFPNPGVGKVNGAQPPASAGVAATNSSRQVTAATAHGIAGVLNCPAASASGTAYTCSTTPTFTPTAGDSVILIADVASTGSATLAVNGASAATIKKQGGSANLVLNDMLIGQSALVTFDGTNWQMQTQTGNASGVSGVTSITLQGTANEITVTGVCTVTTTGTCTFSVPSDFRLPGTINKLTLTQPATGATVTIVDGKTFTVNKTLTFDGTDGVTITFPASSATVATLGLTNTFTGRQDAGGAASTAPAKVVSSDPGTCTVGDLIFNTAATAGQNIKGCTSSNTFTAQGGGGGVGVLLSGASDPALPAINKVQSIAGALNTTSTAFPSSVTAGHLLIAVIGTANLSGVSHTVTDTKGNTWTRLVTGDGNTCSAVILYAIANSSGADTVTVTSSFGGGWSTLSLVELSGDIGAFDASGSSINSSLAPAVSSTGTYDFFISAEYVNGTLPTFTSPEAALFTNTNALNGLVSTVITRSAIGSYRSSLTSSSGNGATVTAAFKSVAPTSVGSVGDWYINLTTGVLWAKSVSGWAESGWKWTPQ